MTWYDPAPYQSNDNVETPEISIVVPTYNGERTVVDCLRSVRAAVGDRYAEIIVSDSSTDSTADLIAQQFPEVRLLRSKTRMSAGAARNRGAAASCGRLLFFTDQDCVVPSDWLTRLEAHLSDPSIDGVGGAVGIRNPTSASGCALYFLEFLYHFPARRDPQRDTTFLVGCNAAYRAHVLRAVSFPDQTIGEDVLFGRQVRHHGFHTLYDPTLEVLHQNKEGWRTFFAYNHRMGQASADYQHALGRRSGAIALRYPALAFGAPIVILPSIARRLMSSHRSYFRRFSVVAPMCLVGNLCWATGFWTQARARAAAARNGDVAGDVSRHGA